MTIDEVVSEKVGAATVRVSDVVAEKLPEIPVIVIVDGPATAVLVALKVIIEDPTPRLGRIDAVTPLGRPETVKLTLPVNPFCALSVTYD